MKISEKELRENVAKMERGTPVIKGRSVLVVVDLKDGNQTTNYFTLMELDKFISRKVNHETQS